MLGVLLHTEHYSGGEWPEGCVVTHVIRTAWKSPKI